MIPRHEAIFFVDNICNQQKAKHGDHHHDVPEWIIIMRRQLQKVEDAWYRGKKTEALHRIGHVAACGVTALQQNGVREFDAAQQSDPSAD